ncbi:uncharacterized protein LOC143265497 [Megachile rotundata]|uniref:uncharacterized protein LOC143265497 n=1 Tax=Megachile rotundata TaxID=143995 RepID=UPI003FD68633
MASPSNYDSLPSVSVNGNGIVESPEISALKKTLGEQISQGFDSGLDPRIGISALRMLAGSDDYGSVDFEDYLELNVPLSDTADPHIEASCSTVTGREEAWYPGLQGSPHEQKVTNMFLQQLEKIINSQVAVFELWDVALTLAADVPGTLLSSAIPQLIQVIKECRRKDLKPAAIELARVMRFNSEHLEASLKMLYTLVPRVKLVEDPMNQLDKIIFGKKIHRLRNALKSIK